MKNDGSIEICSNKKPFRCSATSDSAKMIKEKNLYRKQLTPIHLRKANLSLAEHRVFFTKVF